MIEKLALIAAGGAIGAVARFLAAAWFGRLVGAGFMGTMFVNIVGSFAMGVLAVLLIEKMIGGWGRLAPFMMTGMLGAFTTFSAFSLDALNLIERGRMAAAAGYICGSVVLSVLALLAGLAMARAVA